MTDDEMKEELIKILKSDGALAPEETIYRCYIDMLKEVSKIENMRSYLQNDRYVNSQDFRSGFLAGVRMICSIIKYM